MMMLISLGRRAALGALFLLLAGVLAARADIEIREVAANSGVTAWLVEDYTVPLIAVEFAFRGGATQDPAGKEGLAHVMTGLFDEGAGDLDADAFQERMDDVGLEMRFSADRDAIRGSLTMLQERREEAVSLARMAINAPRFDEAPFERIRSQVLNEIRAKERDPMTEAGKLWDRTFYGDHPYARQARGTAESLAAIERGDLAKLHRRLFARGELYIGIVGAINAEEAAALIDSLFGALPEQPQLTAVADAELTFGEELRVEYDLPQASLRLAWPGVKRSDPKFFAAFVMNHILGGGTFSSRLYTEVREKRGLAYGVGSYIANLDHASSLMISTATQNSRVGEAMRVIRDEVARMAAEGPTAEELAAAKKTIIGGYAVSNLTSSGSVAGVLLELQMEDLGRDYIERRAGLIDAVTLEETREVARQIFTVAPTTMIVGPARMGE